MRGRFRARFDPRRHGLAAGVACLVLSCIASALEYAYTQRAYESDTRDRLQRLATSVAAMVDGDLHQTITSPHQEGSAEYETAVAPLRSFLRATPDLSFVYTLRLVGGRPCFVLDATPPGDADRDGIEDHSRAMDVYDDAPETATRALVQGVPMTTPGLYEDRWGALLSGYAPVRDRQGRMVGVLGIDMSAVRYEEVMSGLRRVAGVSIGIGVALSLAVGLTVHRLLLRSRRAVRRSVESREARADAEERYRIVSEASSDAILVIDDVGVIRYANPAAGRIFGRAPEELQDRLSIAVIPELVRGAPPHVEIGSRAQDGIARPLELTIRRKDGVSTIVEVTLVETRAGDRTLLTTFFRDVSKRRLIDEQTRAAVNAKMEFLAIVTHELRTPLTVIKECTEIIEEGCAGPVNDEQAKFLVIAKRNVQRLSRLVNNVLDYQKLEARRMEIVKEPTDIDALVVEVCASFSVLAAEKGLTIEPELHGALPAVPLDRDRIIQVLSNYIDNAVKYTPKGRVVVRTELAGDDRVRVSVIDEGPGVPPGETSELFGVFKQLSNARTHKIHGTGLGLSVCRKLIELHSGVVGAESCPGRGATFYFEIPVRSEGLTHGEAGADRGRREGRDGGAVDAVPVEWVRRGSGA